MVPDCTLQVAYLLKSGVLPIRAPAYYEDADPGQCVVCGYVGPVRRLAGPEVELDAACFKVWRTADAVTTAAAALLMIHALRRRARQQRARCPSPDRRRTRPPPPPA